MADFLLDLGYGSERLFFQSEDVTSAYQVSYIYIKFKGWGSDFNIFKGAPLSHFATPKPKIPIRYQMLPLLMHVKSFVSFQAPLAALKC